MLYIMPCPCSLLTEDLKLDSVCLCGGLEKILVEGEAGRVFLSLRKRVETYEGFRREFEFEMVSRETFDSCYFGEEIYPGVKEMGVYDWTHEDFIQRHGRTFVDSQSVKKCYNCKGTGGIHDNGCGDPECCGLPRPDEPCNDCDGVGTLIEYEVTLWTHQDADEFLRTGNPLGEFIMYCLSKKV